MFFDNMGKHIIEQRLWWIGNISFGLLDLFKRIIGEYPYAVLMDGFDKELEELGGENETIKKELMKNERFARWL